MFVLSKRFPKKHWPMQLGFGKGLICKISDESLLELRTAVFGWITCYPILTLTMTETCFNKAKQWQSWTAWFTSDPVQLRCEHVHINWRLHASAGATVNTWFICGNQLASKNNSIAEHDRSIQTWMSHRKQRKVIFIYCIKVRREKKAACVGVFFTFNERLYLFTTIISGSKGVSLTECFSPEVLWHNMRLK